MNISDELLNDCFPNHGNDLNGIIHNLRSVCCDLDISDKDIETLRSVGKDTKGIGRLSDRLYSGRPLAMEYLGPIMPGIPYDTRLCNKMLAGYDISVLILTENDGTPCGLVPLEPFTGHSEVFSSLRGKDCTIVTDIIPYSNENIHALEISGCDFILREGQFPISYGPSSGQKMQSLKYRNKNYSACKCRYDKRWLFKFCLEEDTKIMKDAIGAMGLRTQESNGMMESAGHEHAISDFDHDIREVRGLIDSRLRIDRIMQISRTLLSSDKRLYRDRDVMVGFILAFILSNRPEFR